MEVLKFNNVYKNYCNEGKDFLVLDDINFSIKEGEIIAITGPSGCGKSTILNLISKLVKPSLGEIYVNGEVGYMFQHDQLLDYRNVYKNVILGLEIKKIDKDLKRLEEVNRLLEMYGLSDFKKSYPKELSGGMRQRVALIRTLAINPSILLLDEPFASLDYQTKLTVIDDIYKIIKKEKKTTILVTHDISEAISMADRIIVLSKRPSRIKNIYDIKLPELKEQTPYFAKQSKEFQEYFDSIWKEIQDES